MPRIELGSHEPESCILPLYYTPYGFFVFTSLFCMQNLYVSLFDLFFRSAGNWSRIIFSPSLANFRDPGSHRTLLRAICSAFQFICTVTYVAYVLIMLLLYPFLSECRELNPGRIHPMDVYYRYTTLRNVTPTVNHDLLCCGLRLSIAISGILLSRILVRAS